MNTEAKKDRLVGMKFTIAVIGSRVERLEMKWALCRALFCGQSSCCLGNLRAICTRCLFVGARHKKCAGDPRSVQGHNSHDPRFSKASDLASHPQRGQYLDGHRFYGAVSLYVYSVFRAKMVM